VQYTPTRRFVYVSNSGNIRSESSRLEYVALRPSYLMEVWLSPALGFDVANGRARIYGDGQTRVQIGGPAPTWQPDAVKLFERSTQREFAVGHVPPAALEAQHESDDPLQKSLAALSLSCATGDAIPEARDNAARYGVPLTSLTDFARKASA
jgi:hypothetical protein